METLLRRGLWETLVTVVGWSQSANPRLRPGPRGSIATEYPLKGQSIRESVVPSILAHLAPVSEKCRWVRMGSHRDRLCFARRASIR